MLWRVYARAMRTCVCELTGPTADGAGIVRGTVDPRFKYWLTQVGSKRAWEGLHHGALGDRLRTPYCTHSRSPHSGGCPRRSGKVSSQRWRTTDVRSFGQGQRAVWNRCASGENRRDWSEKYHHDIAFISFLAVPSLSRAHIFPHTCDFSSHTDDNFQWN